MTSVLETYLGWEEPRHLAGCRRPSWQVDVRTDHGEYRDRLSGQAHACANDACDHGDRTSRTTVRIVCPSCQAALVICGDEASTSQGMTANTTHGYGQQPRTMAGLLLWPGEPWLTFGRLSSDEPYDYVVTRKGVKHVTEADVVGVIVQQRGKRGAVVWDATALPRPGKYRQYRRLDWDRATDKPLRTVAAAAKWIAAQLAEQQTGGAA